MSAFLDEPLSTGASSPALFSSHGTLVNNFNGFMSSNYGVHNAYAATIKAGGTLSGGSNLSEPPPPTE